MTFPGVAQALWRSLFAFVKKSIMLYLVNYARIGLMKFKGEA